MRRRLLAAALLVGALAACTPMPAPVLSGGDQGDLARVAAYLNGIPRFQARFVQSGDYGPGAGLVWVDRPGRLRIDYEGAGSRVMVITAGRVTALDRARGATTTMPVSRTPLGILLDVPLRLDGPVTVESLQHAGEAGAPLLRLVLSKTGAAAQGRLTLDLADTPLRLVAVSVTDAHRRTLTMQLSGIDTSPDFTPALFQPPVASPTD